MSTEQQDKLDQLLEAEKNQNAIDSWIKLDKTVKLKKLLAFADSYAQEHSLEEAERQQLVVFFKDCLDKKKLQRVKDVNYDKENGCIRDIPALAFHKPNNHFTLRNVDKRVSTLKGLAPKKKQGTVKNKNPV